MRASARTLTIAGALAVVVVVVVIALAGRTPEEPAPSAGPPRVVTIVQDDAELLHRDTARTAATLDDLRELGVDWVRVTAGWSVIAPQPGAARRPDFDATNHRAYPAGAWAALDRLSAMVRERGMRLNIDIAFFAPRWAVERPGRDPARERDGPSPADLADFAEAVARRYADAAAFTIWNEPNHPVFLLPQWRRDDDGRWQPASPDVYRRMVRATVPRIRAAAPRATVLIGGTSSVGSAAGDDRGDRMAPLTFLRALLCVDEELRAVRDGECAGFTALPGDGWAHHPYSLELPPWEDDPRAENVRMGDLARLSSALETLHRAGRTEQLLGLYLTESGYQTNPPDPTWNVSLAEHAHWTAEAERVARANPLVRGVAQFLARDLPERPGDTAAERWRDYQSGLRFVDGSPKPAHAAFGLPLVVHRAGAGRVRLWGLVRGGAGDRPVRVDVRDPAGGPWRPLARPRTTGDGTFETTVAADPDASFRLVAGAGSGAVVTGAR